jgi:CRISPR-associated protein Cmr5
MMSADQRRARCASQLVSLVDERAKKKEYQALIKGLPALIHQAGLLQALAFLAAKAGSDSPKRDETAEHALVLRHIAEMLADARLASTTSSLIEQCAAKELVTYSRMTQEVVAALGWLKRLSVAAWTDLESSRGAGR